MVEGRSRDTVHIERLIYHAYANQWDDKRQPLYKVTLYTKRNSMLWEYIPSTSASERANTATAASTVSTRSFRCGPNATTPQPTRRRPPPR